MEVLQAYRETVDSRWMFLSLVKEDMPMTPSVRKSDFMIYGILLPHYPWETAWT